METPTTLKAIPILDPDNSVDHELLEHILLQDHIKDLNVAVVSIAGAFREGKSFLMNHCLHYMRSIKQNKSWLEDENIPLTGFDWKRGSTRCTKGILMWPEIFTVNLPNGEEVAVIFLDTQGTFDPGKSDKENVTVFTLSTLLCSIQVFNVFRLINENHLQHLELFSGYGCLLSSEHGTSPKPFQKLQILVRDWEFIEKAYGFDGGRKHLDEVLQASVTKDSHQKLTRDFIQSVYTDIRCFLMPHPGDKVIQAGFDGRLCDLKKEFKKQLGQLLPSLLRPEHLVLKEIAGQKIKVKEWLSYVKSYMDAFNDVSLPEPQSLLASTAAVHIQSIVESKKAKYNQLMLESFEELKPYMTIEEREKNHNQHKTDVLKQYDEKPKLGDTNLCQSGRAKLIEVIEADYGSFKKINELEQIHRCNEAVVAAIKIYDQEMDASCVGVGYFEFRKFHEISMNKAMEEFKKGCKEAEDSSNSHRKKLEEAISTLHKEFRIKNKSKRSTIHMIKGAVAGVGAGGISGAAVGSRIGSVVGMLEGPVGMAIGTAVGAVAGGLIGVVCGAIKAAWN